MVSAQLWLMGLRPSRRDGGSPAGVARSRRCAVVVAFFVVGTAPLLSFSPLWATREAGAATGAVASCAPGALRVTVAEGVPSMAHTNLVILVQNRGRRPCSVGPTPAVDFLGPAARVVGSAATSVRTGARAALTLGPGETAAAPLSGTDVPVGGAPSCPSYDRYVVKISGTRKILGGPLEDCAGLTVASLLPGFTGTATGGQVSGRVPACPASAGPSGAGPFVQITARSGNVVAGATSVVAPATGSERFRLALAPGRYRMSSPPAPSRGVMVRAGRTTDMGLFGSCTAPPATVSTIPPAAGGSTTTTTILPPAAVAAAPRCTSAVLVVTAARFGAGLGNVAEVIGFRNVGGALCTLTGYPGVAALDGQGRQVQQARRRPSAYLGGLAPGATPPTVRLEPGQIASATVDGADNPVGDATSCPYYPAFLVTVPDETHSVVLRGVGWQGADFATQGFPGCALLTVTPVVPGESGNSP
jgi:hypothetical protein